MTEKYKCPLCEFLMTKEEIQAIEFDFVCPKCGMRRLSEYVLQDPKEVDTD